MILDDIRCGSERSSSWLLDPRSMPDQGPWTKFRKPQILPMFLPQSVHPKLSQPSSDHGSFHPATAQDLGICLLATEKWQKKRKKTKDCWGLQLFHSTYCTKHLVYISIKTPGGATPNHDCHELATFEERIFQAPNVSPGLGFGKRHQGIPQRKKHPILTMWGLLNS